MEIFLNCSNFSLSLKLYQNKSFFLKRNKSHHLGIPPSQQWNLLGIILCFFFFFPWGTWELLSYRKSLAWKGHLQQEPVMKNWTLLPPSPQASVSEVTSWPTNVWYLMEGKRMCQMPNSSPWPQTAHDFALLQKTEEKVGKNNFLKRQSQESPAHVARLVFQLEIPGWWCDGPQRLQLVGYRVITRFSILALQLNSYLTFWTCFLIYPMDIIMPTSYNYEKNNIYIHTHVWHLSNPNCAQFFFPFSLPDHINIFRIVANIHTWKISEKNSKSNVVNR